MTAIIRKIGKTLYRYWYAFAMVVGRVNSVIILSLLYIVLIGLYSMTKKIVALPFVVFRKPVSPSSYWIEKKHTEPSLETLKRQF